MKLSIEKFRQPPQIMEVVDFVDARINNRDYDEGQLESFQYKLSYLLESYARLLNTLCERGNLNAQELEDIVQGYSSENDKLIK
jgi:hypothetical protein